MKPLPTPPSPTAAGFALERFVPYRLSVLTNTVSGAIGRLYGARFGLTIAEWRVLAVLGRFAPLSAGEVALRTAMDKVRVSRAVAKLIGRALVDHARDGADRRRAKLALSAAGRKIHDAIVPMALAKESELLAGLSRAERAQLDRLLDRLTARAAALDSGAAPPPRP